MISYIIATVAAIAAIASALYARRATRIAEKAQANAKRTISRQAVHNLLVDYRGVHMLAAIEALYSLQRHCEAEGKDIGSEYQRIREEQQIQYESLKSIERINFLATTLHHQRRLVSHFYYLLKTALDSGMVDEEDVFRIWNLGTLEIIPTILDKIAVDPDKALTALYERAKQFENRRLAE